MKTTDGYNYIALHDDVWVYTGVTSVGGDQSNVGFVLMNQRTAETKYYSISGAEEYSAMNSAEGKVQHLGYKATFPLLLNISGEPTYFICLKDSAGLVKQYAMVNIEKYTIVATGSTIAECEKDYRNQMKNNNVDLNAESTTAQTITGVIQKIAQTVIDGNSHFILLLENNNELYEVNVAEEISIIRYNEGDSITFQYETGTPTNSITSITN